MTSPFLSRRLTITQRFGYPVACTLVVALLASLSPSSCADAIYGFSTDSSPQTGTDYPASNLSGNVEFDRLGNLVTYGFEISVEDGTSLTFTPDNSSFSNASGPILLEMTVTYPIGPPFIYDLSISGLGDETPNATTYGLAVNFGRGAVTSGTGHWSVLVQVPEPGTVTLMSIAAACWLALHRRSRIPTSLCRRIER